MRADFNLYKRTYQGKKKYYVKFWDTETEKFTGHISVDTLKKTIGKKADHLLTTNKPGCEGIVRLWLQDKTPKDSVNVIEYLSDFWSPSGEYVKQKALRGNPLSTQYLDNNISGINKYVIPYFKAVKESMSLHQLTSAHLENMLMSLSEKDISNRRVNSIYQAVTVALSEAKRLGKIKTNPADNVSKLREIKPTRKILTPLEVKKFFEIIPEDVRLYTINMLSATTGMRLGECIGLQKDDVHETWIEIKSNWQPGEGLKAPKWGSNRSVPVPSKTISLLRDLIDSNIWNNDFVFFGSTRHVPIGKRTVENYFTETIHRIGITEEERKARRLTFHAWRHFYNTMLRGHIPDHALRKLTGHKNEEMTDKYSNITDEQRKAVAELAETIFE